MKKLLNKNAITLIALVITIVVLIILAAVAINLSLGNNGIFNRAKNAKEQYQNAQDYESTKVENYGSEIDGLVDSSRETVTLTKEQYDAIVNKTIAIDCKTPSAESDWHKVADYPEGFNYDNCYILSGYVLYSNTKYKYTLSAGDYNNWAIDTRLSENGIEMLIRYNNGFSNKDAKIILSKY